MVQDKLPHGRVCGQTCGRFERRLGVAAIVNALDVEMPSGVQVLFEIFRGLFEVHDLETIVCRTSPEHHGGHTMFRIGKRFDQRASRTAGKHDDRRKVIAAETAQLTREKRSGTHARAPDAFLVDVELRRYARKHIVEKREFFVHAALALQVIEGPLELDVSLGFRNDRNEALCIGGHLDLPAIIEIIGASAEPMPQEQDGQPLVGFHIDG